MWKRNIADLHFNVLGFEAKFFVRIYFVSDTCCGWIHFLADTFCDWIHFVADTFCGWIHFVWINFVAGYIWWWIHFVTGYIMCGYILCRKHFVSAPKCFHFLGLNICHPQVNNFDYFTAVCFKNIRFQPDAIFADNLVFIHFLDYYHIISLFADNFITKLSANI